MVALTRQGAVDDAGPAARHLLAAYGGPGLPPAPVRRWLAGDPAAAPLELAGRRGVLSVTHFRQGDTTILLLEEIALGPRPRAAARAGPDPARRRGAGAGGDGRDNAQIADALVISPATVRKHLERIYAKLGVHTRTEAAARAHGAPAPDPG